MTARTEAEWLAGDEDDERDRLLAIADVGGRPVPVYLDRQPVPGELDVDAFFGMGTPWPMHEVVRTLAEATRHLLAEHDCDHLGWERLQAALEVADERIPPP